MANISAHWALLNPIIGPMNIHIFAQVIFSLWTIIFKKRPCTIVCVILFGFWSEMCPSYKQAVFTVHHIHCEFFIN